MKPNSNLYRAVVHVHTNWSYDGLWSVSKIRSIFAKMGVDIVLTAEHSQDFQESKWNQYKQLCRDSSTEQFNIIPGIEYTDNKNLFHIMVWGCIPFLGENHDIGELLKIVDNLGGVAVLAHPSRREAWREYNSTWSAYLTGVEIWNRKADGWKPSIEAYRLLNSADKYFIPFVGLDFHNFKQLYPLIMKLRIDGKVAEDSVVAALRQGRCESIAWGFPVARFSCGNFARIARWSENIRKNVVRAISSIKKHIL